MCKDCAERRKMVRDAFLKAKFGEAAKQLAKGAAEIVGLKPKTAVQETRKRAVKTGRS